MTSIIIDGKAYPVEEGLTLLKVLRDSGKDIPSLCHHPALKKPIGACKLCAVEIQVKDKPRKVGLSCVVKTSDGLVVETASEAVRLARSKAIHQLLALAPQSEPLLKLAASHGIETPFSPMDVSAAIFVNGFAGKSLGPMH